MGTVTAAVQGALGVYVLTGIAMSIVVILNVLRDRDMVRVLQVSVFDVMAVFSLAVLLWPMVLKEMRDHDGPWRG